MKTLVLMVGVLGVLAGCEMDNTGASGESPARPFPDASTVKSIAIRGYQATRHQAPAGLRVDSVQQANAFIGLPPDHLVCVSTTENTVYSVYDNAGNLVAPAGVPFRQSYVMLVRDYPHLGGWASGVFRRVEEGKIGHIDLTSVCPPSER